MRAGIDCDTFVYLDVPDEALVERVVGRRLDPETGKIYHLKFSPPPADILPRLLHRDDDTEEKVKTRIEAFHHNLNPLLQRYQDKVLRVDGSRAPAVVWSDLYPSLARSVKYSVVFVLGGPSAGKREYCRRMSSSFEYTHISLTEQLYSQHGWNLHSDKIVDFILGSMVQSHSRKFVIDSFPRDIADLKCWYEIVGESCIVDHVVYLECNEEIANQRLLAETPNINKIEISSRFNSFRVDVMPVVSAYRWLGKIRQHSTSGDASPRFDFHWVTKNLITAPIQQRTLAIIKPDALANGHLGDIVSKLESEGIGISHLRLIRVIPKMVEEFFQGAANIDQLKSFYMSGPTLIMILDGREVIRRWNAIIGPSSPQKARETDAKSLRALYGTDDVRNACHGSENEYRSFREIYYWTDAHCLGSYAENLDPGRHHLVLPATHSGH